jgi:hypothetical protein
VFKPRATLGISNKKQAASEQKINNFFMIAPPLAPVLFIRGAKNSINLSIKIQVYKLLTLPIVLLKILDGNGGNLLTSRGNFSL